VTVDNPEMVNYQKIVDIEVVAERQDQI